MKLLRHIVIIAASLFLFLGIPCLRNGRNIRALLHAGETDAVSGATMEVPDTPSGNFLVLINREKHPDTMEDWEDFFSEKPVGVIFEDISCTVPAGDEAAYQLADRYRLRLAENQMVLKRENAMMAVSKAQWGIMDVMIISEEMADILSIDTVRENKDIEMLRIAGAAEAL